MAEVLDGRTDLNPWRDFDVPDVPSHSGKPWLLPFVGANCRLQDLIR